MNAQHLSMSQEWYTPVNVIEATKEVMGGIDLDPASCETANSIVGAGKILSANDNGLLVPWSGRVFLNPPGGRSGNRSLAGMFWNKLVKEFDCGNVSEAVFLAFSIESLQVTQAHEKSMAHFPVCLPAKRLKYWRPSGTGMSPTHASAIAYLGPNKDKFKAVFSQFGKVVIPA